MLSEAPLVSIIVPFKDRFSFLREACESVFNQNYSNFEMLLIDDGSTQDFDDNKIKLHPKVRYFKQANRGPAAARNWGIQEARGKYIAFLDSDDVFHPAKLTTQVTAMEEKPNVVLSHTSFFQFKENIHDSQNTVDTSDMNGHLFPRIVLSCSIATPTVMVRSEIMKQYLFDEDLRAGEDTVVWTRLAAQFPFMHIQQPLSYIRLHGANTAINYQNKLNYSKTILSKLSHHGVDVPLLHKYITLTKSLIVTVAAKTLQRHK